LPIFYACNNITINHTIPSGEYDKPRANTNVMPQKKAIRLANKEPEKPQEEIFGMGIYLPSQLRYGSI